MMSLYSARKSWWIAALGVVTGIVAAAFLLPGGDDLYRYYQPFEQGCLNCGYVPYFAQWFLWPLLLPHPYAWPMWVFISSTGFLLIARWTKVNPFLLLVSMPMLAQLWGGQIDVIVAAGLLLAAKGRNPYLRGLGISMALIKPQLSFLALLFLLLQEKRVNLWKLLLPPFLIIVSSLFIFGVDWPLEWIRNALALPVHLRRQASVDIWPLGIFLVWVPFLFRESKRRLIASMVIGSIATPFFSIYSYVIFLAFYLPPWAVIVSYSWLLLFPWLGVETNRFAWVLPLSLLFSLTLKELKERCQPSDKEKTYARL